jgi:hypothetical protein
LTSEVIFKEDLEAIFGKRPWDPIEEEKETPVQEAVVANEEVTVQDADFTATEDTPHHTAQEDNEPTANE